MKKLIAILLAALMLLSLAACGDKPAENTTDTETAAESGETAAVTGETFDAGDITVTVPSGWTAIPQHDVFSDDPKAMLTDVVNVCKGGKTADDLFSKPYIRFDFGTSGETPYYISNMPIQLPFVVLLQWLCLVFFRAYRRIVGRSPRET